MFILYNLVGWTIVELGLAPYVVEFMKALLYIIDKINA